MQKLSKANSGRFTERLLLIAGIIILGTFFFRLHVKLEEKMFNVPEKLKAGKIVNLNAPDLRKSFKILLKQEYYLTDQKDIELISTIADSVITSSGTKLTTIGELNKRRFNIDADRAELQGGKVVKSRLDYSRALLGFNFIGQPAHLPQEVQVGTGAGEISGRVTQATGAAVGVLIRLNAVIPADSLEQKPLTAYARTGSDGTYRFSGLTEDMSFEVLPIQPGKEFGQVKGVQELQGSKRINFRSEQHTIRLIAPSVYNQLKKDGALIVRTPEQFRSGFYWITGLFFAAFIVLHLLMSMRFPTADQFILPIIFLLSGISLLTLLSLQDPLRDRFLAIDSVKYLLIGLSVLSLLLFTNLRKFHPDSAFYRLYLFRMPGAANGWPWIAGAMFILALTLLFGAGPQGSGVRVNLLGIQPSELVKYLTIIFLAGFFTRNESFISSYASWTKRWQFFSFALVAIVGTLFLFLLLGDLGPAMVICFTFIFLFSFSRGDFMQMAAFVLLFVLCCWISGNIWLSIGFTAAVLVIRTRLLKKTISESALMALVVLSAFLTIDQLPLLAKLIPGPVARLSDRKAIWQDAWDNEVYGGDQVANGLWAMASGGLKGQGIGEGYGKTIPEGHTDMILPVIAEEFGLAGIACVFALFMLYLHRSFLIGRASGTPLIFYLCAGIGLSTFVQFILIAGGSTGALPLSGVSLPLLSYGGSSMVINLLAAAFLLSASMVKGTAVQLKYMQNNQDHNLVPALLTALAAVTLLTVHASKYSLFPSGWIVKPALVADRSGSRLFSYNPRIGILLQKLEAGNLYDRNGLLLATSDPKEINRQHSALSAAGINSYDLDSAVHSRSTRYYPFQEQLFFWTGDANTGVFNGGINGYFAEYQHAAELRGFKLPAVDISITASKYKEDRFLPASTKEMTVSRKDYSELLPILRSGLDTNEIAKFKKKDRNVRLAVDAALQTRLQQAMIENSAISGNRVSVVVMSSSTGDVLASAAYPLPPVHDWEALTMPVVEQRKLSAWYNTADPGFTVATQPGSTVKILTALAGFNKLGISAAEKTFLVRTAERIRTGGAEPDETGNINMEQAIVRSNNVYFIKLANEAKLGEQLASLYLKTGMFLNGVGGYYYGRKTVDPEQIEKWTKYWNKTVFNLPYHPENIYKYRASGISGIAWGQGELIATPAAVARVASGIANHGEMIPNRYALSLNGKTVPVGTPVKLADKASYANLIQSYMIRQSAPRSAAFGISVAGKTGTPERMLKGKKVNDGWYVFFAPDGHGNGETVVCIRIEATRGSSDATRLAAETVVPILRQQGYITSIQ
ncbi:FtsW/RodA/SpoVE family cell cycle protein [Pedobacter antarcticus]|uniref:FtsW/RodA/SpoVE family cell cycle protein n=1 Tax=Pedobacter antarcticus TaxID=34086 RepID=UPI000884862C|nr:FtsW/RodA/SpoVE family cell cycle protein [Pedobacter antarcticus]SDL77364.1 cell division protein FtsW, lipid II flippase [Pedobacter antarcticus]